MTDIKFRVWNGACMDQRDLSILINLYWEKENKVRRGKWFQYTGLKDNKRTKEYPEGQEIYEGDIVRFLDDMQYIVSKEKKYLIGEVRFIDGAFWCFYEDEENLTRLVSVMVDYWAEELKGNQCEIIGNIKENPELIGQK